MVKYKDLFYTFMSKYTKDILDLLKKDVMKSTNEVLKELEAKTKKTINWHLLHRVLTELEEEGRVEKLKAKAGFFWRRK